MCGNKTGKEGRKHGALRPQKLLTLIRDGEGGGGRGSGIFISNTYSLHCHHQNDCIKVGSCVSHFNLSLIVWAKSQDSEEKGEPKRIEQPCALPLGHTGSLSKRTDNSAFTVPLGAAQRFRTCQYSHLIGSSHNVGLKLW